MGSRKLLFAAVTLLAVIGASRVVPEVTYDGCVMGLVSVCAIYVGGNAATRWVHGRGKPKAKKQPDPVPEIKQGE